MKRVFITINGKEYPMAFSNRVLINIEDKFGGLEKLNDVMSDKHLGEVLKNTIYLLAQMISAGCKDCEKSGIKCEEPLTEDDLLDYCSVQELGELKEKIYEAINETAKPSIEVESPKKQEAAPKN